MTTLDVLIVAAAAAAACFFGWKALETWTLIKERIRVQELASQERIHAQTVTKEAEQKLAQITTAIDKRLDGFAHVLKQAGLRDALGGRQS